MRDLSLFERLVRVAHEYSESEDSHPAELHPFDTRNIHPDLPRKVRSLFDDGYFAEATFEAFKFIEKEVKRISSVARLTGNSLMMAAFNEKDPAISLNNLSNDSERDEQFGYRYIFAGAQSGIRNPRGHETDLVDSPDLCLDHLVLASVLLRKLDNAGVR